MTEAEPALSAEQWRNPVDVFDGHVGFFMHAEELDVRRAAEAGSRERHELAALLLAGQPFGFTWEDVDVLRFFAKNHFWIGDVDRAATAEAGQKASHLADRIAALLPPRESA